MRDIQRNRTRNDLRFFLVCICAPKCRNDPIHARRPRLCGRDHRLRVCRRALYRCDWGWYWVHVRLAAYSPRVHPWRYGYPARSRCQGRRFGRLGVISPAISRGVRKMPPLCDTVYISSRLNVATFACSPGLCISHISYHTFTPTLVSYYIGYIEWNVLVCPCICGRTQQFRLLDNLDVCQKRPNLCGLRQWFQQCWRIDVQTRKCGLQECRVDKRDLPPSGFS